MYILALADEAGLEPAGAFLRPVNSRVRYHSAHPSMVDTNAALAGILFMYHTI